MSILEYKELKEEGLKKLREYCGDNWTDHNLHDPGITILENLCYALTDLSYRLNFPIEDILHNGKPDFSPFSLNAERLLSTAPVTLKDLELIVSDLHGVRGVIIEPLDMSTPQMSYQPDYKGLSYGFESKKKSIRVKGLLRVWVEKDLHTKISDDELLNNVKAVLQANRPLCQDFDTVVFLKEQKIPVQIKVSMNLADNPEEIMGEMMFLISEAMSPSFQWSKAQWLFDEEQDVLDFIDGPRLSKGYLSKIQRNKKVLQQELHSTIFYDLIENLRGVDTIQVLTVGNGVYTYPIDLGKVPRLDLDNSIMEMVVKGQKIYLDREKVIEAYEKKLKRCVHSVKNKNEGMGVTVGEYRELNKYTSIQNHFPSVYGINEHGVEGGADNHRKAQARQLKAYLCLFEQLLADYHEQIAHVHELLDMSPEEGVGKVYFYQDVAKKIPNGKGVYRDEDNYLSNVKRSYDSEKMTLDQRNKLLDHLLNRIGEDGFKFEKLYHSADVKIPKEKIIRQKQQFLNLYSSFGGGRNQSFNYSLEFWDKDNVPAVVKRLKLLLGIEEFENKSLVDGSTEGFHFIEHVLLRPMAGGMGSDKQLIQSTIEILEEIEEGISTGRQLICESSLHGLMVGELLEFYQDGNENGVYRVIGVLDENRFKIEFLHELSGNNRSDKRQGLRAPFMTFSRPIQSTQFHPGTFRTLACESYNHGLEVGETIEIISDSDLQGLYYIDNVLDNNRFVISVERLEEDFSIGPAKWVRANHIVDPYSLQCSFVFPGDLPMYQKSKVRKGIETLIRNEMPAHLRVYVQWLSTLQMREFEGNYKSWIKNLEGLR